MELMDVVEMLAFAKARLDDEDAAAKAAGESHLCAAAREGCWQDVGLRDVRYDNGAGETLRSVDVTGRPWMWYEQIRVAGDPEGRVAAHIALHDPARALRQVEALRRIVLRCEARINEPGGLTSARSLLARQILADLVMIWNDHPDYKIGWQE